MPQPTAQAAGPRSAAKPAQPQPSPRATVRMVVLTSLGGALEFYDFVSYGIFAAYIAPAFFPAHDELASLMSTFAVFAGGYLIRPLGGIAFSHFGDRLGRRGTFLVSLLGISLATIGMALCPSHQAWGGWATAAFVLLRLLQGFCLGGELPGAITYVFETAAPGRVGLACGLLFCCASLGVVLASGVSAGLHALLPAEAMAQYGWRLAFGFGGVLGILSYLPRRLLLESPAFALVRERREVERLPLALVLRRDLGRVAAGIGTTASVAAFNGVLFAYMPAYLVRVAGYPPATVATAVTAGLVASAAAVLATGALCDVVPARTVFRLGAVALLLACWPFFRAVSVPGTASLAWLLAGFGAVGGIVSGAFAVVLAELFPARVRFSGVALAYNTSFALFSGLGPIAAAALIAATGDKAAPSFYVAAAAAIALVASFWAARLGGRPGAACARIDGVVDSMQEAELRRRVIPDRWPVAVAVVLIAFNLRPAFSSIAPVLNEIMADTGLTAAGASVLTTAPVLCLGLFSPLAPWLAQRIGTERTVLAALFAILLGTGLRGLAGAPALLAGSLVAGAGIGVGNVLMPGLLKRDFPDKAPLMTGVYIMSLSVGAAVAAATTAPLRVALGGWWAGALAAWTLPAAVAMAVAALVWARQIRRQPVVGAAAASAAAPATRPGARLWRDPLAWQVTLFMGLQSMLAYVVFGWMAPVLRSRGDTAVTAGLVVSVSVVFQIIAALPAPILAARLRRQSGPAAVAMLVAAVSFVALLAAPLPWQWALSAVLGLAQGAAFSLAILIILMRAGDSGTAARLSGMAQGVGYTMAAFGPLLVGVLHDRSGGWNGAGWLFVVAGLGAAVAGALAGRNRLVG